MMNDPANEPYALIFHQLCKKKGSLQLGPLDIALEVGQIYALVGPNGSGKSTLLKMMANLIQPDSGSMTIMGGSYAVNETTVKQRIALAPDPLTGCEPFTLHQLGQLIGPLYPDWSHERFRLRAEQFQLPLHKRYEQLSHGSQKKAALTLALSTGAQLLLLDEPTNGLDMKSRRILRQIVAEEMDSGDRTIVLATHLIDDIRQTADSLLLLNHGSLQGPYEKDMLQSTWRKLWIAPVPRERLQDLPGVPLITDGPFPAFLTDNIEAAKHFLAHREIEIMDEQPASLEETIEHMLDRIPARLGDKAGLARTFE